MALKGNKGEWSEVFALLRTLSDGHLKKCNAQLEHQINDIIPILYLKHTSVSGADIYYHIVRQGTGKNIKVTDTVTVYYKGSLLSNGAIFDQTKEKPASFPLNRLIKGWQLAVPKINVGGKITIYIPSGQAYGIRTRSKDIPVNSVLVFDIEVLEAR